MLKDQLELLLKEFNSLKEKITKIIHSHQWALQPKSTPIQVYEKDYLHQLSMQDFLNLRQLGKNKEYEEQLRIRLQEYTQLEKKLEQVRNLIADNEIEKLKRMCKRGEI